MTSQNYATAPWLINSALQIHCSCKFSFHHLPQCYLFTHFPAIFLGNDKARICCRFITDNTNIRISHWSLKKDSRKLRKRCDNYSSKEDNEGRCSFCFSHLCSIFCQSSPSLRTKRRNANIIIIYE